MCTPLSSNAKPPPLSLNAEPLPWSVPSFIAITGQRGKMFRLQILRIDYSLIVRVLWHSNYVRGTVCHSKVIYNVRRTTKQKKKSRSVHHLSIKKHHAISPPSTGVYFALLFLFLHLSNMFSCILRWHKCIPHQPYAGN